MTKLELIIKVLVQDLSNQDLTPDKKTEILSNALRSYACDVINFNSILKKKNVDVEVCKDLIEEYGLSYNAKTDKFS